MSTYSSDRELSLPRILDGHDHLLTFVDVASSYVNNDVRLILGECEFYMAPAVADQLAAALTRHAVRARQYQEPGSQVDVADDGPSGGRVDHAARGG